MPDKIDFEILVAAARLGAAEFAKEIGYVRDEITQRQAYLRFGESRVKKWVAQGKIRRFKEGQRNCVVTYSLIELKGLEVAENLEFKTATKIA